MEILSVFDFNVCTRLSLDLSSSSTQIRKKFGTAASFLELVPTEPGVNKVGTVLACECRLLLDAPECRGKLRSSETAIVASYSCWKLLFLVGRLIGVCSPLTSMQILGS